MAGTSERRQDFAAASHHSSNESAHNDHQNPRRCGRNLGHHRRAVLHHEDYDAKSSRGEVGFFRRQQHRRLGSWNRRYWFLGTYPGGGPPRADASVSTSVLLLEPKMVDSRAEAEAREGASMTKNDFAFRIDRWTDNGERIVEHVAGAEDFQIAMATYHAARKRWPKAAMTLRQDTWVIEDSRRTRIGALFSFPWSEKSRERSAR